MDGGKITCDSTTLPAQQILARTLLWPPFQKLSQGTKDSCIAGDSWTGSSGAQDDVGEGDGGMAEEEDEEMVLDENDEGRWDDSQEPGEIIEEYGMEPTHSSAGTMDVPSWPPSLSLCLAGYTANHSIPLLPLNTNDSAMSE